MSDTVITTIIAALLAVYMEWSRRRAETRVDAVKQDLITANVEHAGKLDEVAAKVEEVHKATNSMKDQLVEATEKEAFLRGGDEERKRSEGRE